MKNVLLFFLVVLSTLSRAQETPIAGTSAQHVSDSLVRQLAHAKEDTARLYLLHLIAYNNRVENPDEGIRYGMEELQLAKQMDTKAGIAQANFDLGSNYIKKSDFKSALYYSEAALKIFSELQAHQKMAQTSTNIGLIYYKLSNFPQALDWYFRSLRIAEGYSLREDAAICQEGIGNVFKAQGNYAKALEYLEKGLKEYEKLGMKMSIMNTLSSIGSVHFYQTNLQSALDCYDSALAIAEQLDDRKSIAENLVCIGNVYSEKGINAKALEYQFKALSIFTAIDNKSGLVNVYGNIGTTYVLIAEDTLSTQAVKNLIPESKGENLKLGINYLRKAIDIEKEIGEQHTLQQLYENISEAYALSGQHKEAYEYYKQYNTIHESIFSKENNVKMANIERNFEQEKQRAIEKINERKKRNERIFFAIGMGLLLLVVVVIGRSYTTQRKLNITITNLVNEQEQVIKERTKELAISNEKLVESNVKLANYNKQLIELMQFNAHNLREPLTRILGAMVIQEYITNEEFYGEVWPQMKKAANDLDVIIKEVISRADEALENAEKQE